MKYLLWIALLLIGFALGNYKYENAKRKTLAGNQGKEFLWMNRKVEMIMVLSVLMVALSIRVWEFGSIPYGIHQDEAMAAVDAKALADYGTDRLGMHMPVHFTAWGYGQMSVFLSYCMVPFIWNTIETPFFTIPYFKDSERATDILFFSEHPLRQLWENLKRIRYVLVDASYLSHNYVNGYTQIPLFLLPFAILGLILLCKQCFKKRTSSTKAEEYALTGKVAVPN